LVTLSIVIVNYNARCFTEQCLHAVAIATSGMDAEVIVVDNASSDGSLPYLQPIFPWVMFIASPANIGFGGASNLGAANARGKFLLMLNPDTLVSETSLHAALDIMKAQPATGALGIRMLDGSGTFLPESKRGFPWLQTSFYKLSGLHKIFPRHKTIARYYMGHIGEGENQYTEVLAGAFMMISLEAWQATGGFDEAFFMYGEDIDLSFRIVQAGYNNFYLAAESIIHFKGESTQRLSPQYLQHFYGAMQTFVGKHYSGWKAMAYKGFVRAAQTMSSMKTNMLASQKNNPHNFRQCIVVASKADAAIAIDILQKQSVTAIRIISPNDWLHQTMSDNTAVLFIVNDQLTISRCIQLMQQEARSPYYLFHYQNSCSIVGSSHKERQGIAWTI